MMKNKENTSLNKTSKPKKDVKSIRENTDLYNKSKKDMPNFVENTDLYNKSNEDRPNFLENTEKYKKSGIKLIKTIKLEF